MYTIKKVSEWLGIPAVTIRAWENRYGLVTPQRTEGGHRLYRDEDVATLRRVKQMLEEKQLRISEVVRALAAQRDQPLPAPASEAPGRQDGATDAIGPRSNTRAASSVPAAASGTAPATAPPSPPAGQSAPAAAPDRRDELFKQLYRSLIELNGEQANEQIDLAFSLYHFEDVFHRILAPVLYRIGEQWEAGLVTVAQEHFATHLVQLRMQQFFRSLPVRNGYPKALAFCPEGEHHQIGLMMFSLFLRTRGLEVIYIGPNTPYDGLIELMAAGSVELAVVSISHPQLADELKLWVDQCRRRLPHLRFVLGGSGVEPCPAELRPYVLEADYASWESWFQKELR